MGLKAGHHGHPEQARGRVLNTWAQNYGLIEMTSTFGGSTIAPDKWTLQRAHIFEHAPQ